MPNPKSLHACNPSFEICFQKMEEDYWDCYVDLTDGRGEDVVKRMRRAIALSPNKPTCQLLAGHVGSGKTTELLRLKTELEQRGFQVLYCAIDDYLQTTAIGLTELWLVILSLLVQQLETQGESLSLAYLPNAIREIELWLRVAAPIGIATYCPRIQKIIQTLQERPSNHNQLQKSLDSRLKNSLLAAGEEVTAIAVERFKQMGKKGLVIIVDNLDRLNLPQTEVLFGEGGKYLRQFQCHVIYTLPLLAIAHTDEEWQERFQHNFKGNVPIFLPNIYLRDRQGIVNSQSLHLLRQVILKRIFPNSPQDISQEKILEQVTNICDRPETLDHLCLASHGNLPYLLSLLYSCLQLQDPPIQMETVQQVLQIDRAMRISAISDRDQSSLEQAVNNPYLLTPDAIALCRRLLLFVNHDSDGYWFTSPFVET
jgi:hypothetical protein